MVDEDELSVFYEAPMNTTRITTWVWNSSGNYTGGSWPGEAMELMGCTADSTRKVYKWTYDGDLTSMPTGIIFVVDGTQTSDLVYRNHGYYVDGVWNHEVTRYTTPAPTLTIDKESGRYIDPVTVTITASESTATIVYTTDGTRPTPDSKTATGMVTLTFSDNTTLMAGVLQDGKVRNVITRQYIFHGFEPHSATIYLKDPTQAPDNWGQVYFYAWDQDGNLLGGWPGQLMTADNTTMVRGTRFFNQTFDIPAEDYTFNIIFSQGDGGHQTIDITGLNRDMYFEISSQTNKYTVRDITADYASLTGDASGDGVVDIADVNAIINVMLGKVVTDELRAASDVNSDGLVDSADVNMVINIMLGK